jgi:phage terminase Nu1 subunit (DNA packaging protein)
MKPKHTLTDAPLRWTLTRAAEETGFARQTVKNRLTSTAQEAGKDGCYSTAQVLAALYGDYDGERLRKLRAEADLAEMERDERARSLIPAAIVEATWTDVLQNLRGVVMGFDLTRQQRHQMLETLRAIPIHEYQAPGEQAGGDDSTEGD